VTALRALLLRHRRLAALLLAAALCLRTLVPAGYMPAAATQSVVVSICHGAGAAEVTIPVKKSLSAAERCAFADLQLPMLGAADPVLLALALAFILALWLAAPAPLLLRGRPHWRPPLRGPPSHP